MRALFPRIGLAALALSLSACGAQEEDDPEGDDGPAPIESSVPAAYEPYAPLLEPSELSPEITNALFPLPVGATWAYEAVDGDELERIEVSVETGTREVWGAEARVVRDTAFIDGALAEDTRDWFAEDLHGNVWYLGEDTAEYEDDVVTSTAGSWEAGVDGALPGVVMLAGPRTGDRYRQEYYAGEAEDYAEIVALDADVSVPAGEFVGCLKTRDRSAIDPTLDEYKYYCSGVGNVLVEEGDVRVELVEYSGLDLD